MMTEVIKIATSLNPKLANRLILTECVSEFSKFAVLIIDPPPTEDPMGFLGRPGITGELKAHLLELTKKSENLKTYLANFGNVEKWDDVWAAVYGRYQQTNVWMNVFQAMRVEFNDSSLGKIGAVKDWFRPFVEAMCAWQESQYRQDLGLSPSLMVAGDATRTSSGMLALAYGGFMNDVLDGAPDPYMTWMKKMDELGLRARGSLR